MNYIGVHYNPYIKKIPNPNIPTLTTTSVERPTHEPPKDIIEEKYGLQFNKLGLKSHEANQLYKMVSFIEKFLDDNMMDSNINKPHDIRFLIGNILTNKETFKQKMGNLGILYRLLEGNKKIPMIYDNLVEHYFNHLNNSVDDLEKKCDNNFCSGKISYLLVNFSLLLLAKNEEFNLGGPYAILQLLKLGLGKYFDEDHLNHLRVVLHNVIRNPALASLMRRPLVIAEGAKFLIRADLHFEKSIEITPFQAKLSTLKALLWDLRQSSNDCYGVAPVTNAIRTSPFKICERIFKIIEQGGYEVEPGIIIPLEPLIKAKISNNHRLTKPLNQEKIIKSNAFYAAIAATCDDEVNISNATKEISVNELIDSIIQTSTVSASDLFLAKVYYLAMTECLIQQALLEVTKFVVMNTIREEDIKTHNLSPFITIRKSEWARFLRMIFFEESQLTIPNLEIGMLEALDHKIRTKIWMQDTSMRVELVDPQTLIVFSNQMSTRIQATPQIISQTKAFFRNFRQLVILEEGKFMPIETISQLLDTFGCMVDEIQSEDKRHNKKINLVYERLKAYLQSNLVVEHLCRHMHTLNKKSLPVFDESNYKQLGRIIFGNHGGSTRMTLHTLQLNTGGQVFESEKTETNIIALCAWLHQSADTLDLIDNKDALLSFSSHGHSFNLTPNKFRFLWKKADVSQTIEEYMTRPALDLLSRPLHPTKIERILKYLGVGKTRIPSLLQHLEKLSADQLKQYMKLSLEPNKYKDFAISFQIEMCTISLEEFDPLSFVRGILIESFGMKKDDPRIPQIQADFGLDLAQENGLMTSLEMACLFKQTLVNYGLIKLETYEIDLFLCVFQKIPCTFILADLNYMDNLFKENPHHRHLGIQFQFPSNTIEYIQKVNDQTKLISDSALLESLKILTVYYPSKDKNESAETEAHARAQSWMDSAFIALDIK